MKRFISFILSTAMALGILFLPFGAFASNAGVISVSSGKLNVRRYGSALASVVSTLKKGVFVTLIAESGDWWLVEYGDGEYGYCHSDYIRVVPSVVATVKISSGSLNVRSGAGVSYPKTDSLSKGEKVIVLSTENDWSKILYDGTKTGFVSARYLSPSTPSYNQVELDVPDFKQTDKRWANVKIGNSGKTIAQIGCVTASIAMIESYRTGSIIYPDTMSKRLTYSSSGDVYWPTDYVPTYTNTDYLEKIYRLLREGKPVLIGAKTYSGGQHWVVITGYKGGDNPTEADFIINDPGSDTRTTLKQFLSVYPVFYKYFYYN